MVLQGMHPVAQGCKVGFQVFIAVVGLLVSLITDSSLQQEQLSSLSLCLGLDKQMTESSA